jgi:hypothetical protein
MGVTFTGEFITAGQLEVLLQQVGERAREHGARTMATEAKHIAETARNYAPIDEGPLEAAIEDFKVPGERNAKGQFTRSTHVVHVDEDMEGSGGGSAGRKVGDYAYLIHEGQVTEGSQYQLGPRSAAKAAATGYPVGGGFLRRALIDRSKEVISSTIGVLKRYF